MMRSYCARSGGSRNRSRRCSEGFAGKRCRSRAGILTRRCLLRPACGEQVSAIRTRCQDQAGRFCRVPAAKSDVACAANKMEKDVRTIWRTKKAARLSETCESAMMRSGGHEAQERCAQALRGVVQTVVIRRP